MWDGQTLWAKGVSGPILMVFGRGSDKTGGAYNHGWGADDVELGPMSEDLRVMFKRLTESQAWMPLLDRIAEEYGDEIAQPFLESYHRGS